jgi:hypothetical protein
MRLLLLTLLLGLSACGRFSKPPEPPKSHIQLTPVHPFPEAALVRLFVETNYDEKTDAPIYDDPKGLLLTPDQRQRYEALLSVQTPINLPPDDPFFMMSMCFDPHHFFRYYDRAGKKIGEIAVCFCCSGVSITPSSRLRRTDQQRLEADYDKLKALVKSWGAPGNVLCGEDE